jgi:hypothetical protein
MFFYVNAPDSLKNQQIGPEHLFALTNFINKSINHPNLIDRIEPVYKECFLNYKGSDNSK